MRAKQALGQNFLMHQATADRIADSAGLTPDSVVLEIGPGTGMLTRSLLARAGRVIAIETDRELVPQLKETFATEVANGQLEIIVGDIRRFDFSTFSMSPLNDSSARRGESGEVDVQTYGGRDTGAPQQSNRAHFMGSYAVVANIPYYITGEIIRLLLSSEHKPASVTLLVQKEVAERIVRSKKESLLSLSVKAYGVPSYKFTVPRGAFYPAPNVDSAVLHVAEIGHPFASTTEEARFFEILHAGFAHKRKRLAKNLESVASAEAIQKAFVEVGLGVNARAEDVELSAWKKLPALL